MSVNSHPGRSTTARKRPVQARSQRTVDTILDAAARIFVTHGYTATTTNHIAEAGGISIGSLYQYFPNKDALLVALEERHLDESRVALRVAMRRWRDEEPGPEAWSRSFVKLLVEINDSPLHLFLYGTAPSLPHLRELVAAMVDEIAGEVAVHLRRWGVRRRTALRARVVVIAALRLVHDLVIQLPPGPDRSRSRREVALLVASYAVAGRPPP